MVARFCLSRSFKYIWTMNLQVFPVMKKRILLVAAFVGALFCACVEIHDEGCRDIILSAYSADSEAFSWSPEDEVSLFRGEGGEGGWKLASITPEPAAAAEFKGDIPVKAIEDPCSAGDCRRRSR